MAGLLRRIRQSNGLEDLPLVEPFAGGAGASLSLLYSDEIPEIHINDADPAIHAFWWTLVKRPKPFLDKLAETPIDISEWRRQRDVYRSGARASMLRRGFAAFYLNRCNRSGVVPNGGPIGGIAQDGVWKLDARFNKPDLLRRCKRVAEHGDRIEVSGDDGIELLDRIDTDRKMLFLDPPYIQKGPTLYWNSFDEAKHRALADRLRDLRKGAWVLTYDDCPKIRSMYKGWAQIRPFALRYTANRRRNGREVLIAPRRMKLPKEQDSRALNWS